MKLAFATGLVLIVAGTAACSERRVSAAELVQWVRDPVNGLVDSVVASPYVLSMQYLPVAVLAATSRTRQDGASSGDSLAVFELSIRSDMQPTIDPVFSDVYDHDAFTQRVASLAFTISDDVKLRLGDRLVSCASAVFQQDVGLRPKRMIRLVFPISEQELRAESMVLVEWRDHEYGTGVHAFRCNTRSLSNLPRLQ